MTGELTRYTFLVQTSDVGGGVDGMDPTYDASVKQLDSDAQAELHARRISEDRRGAWVKIKRADASWGLAAGAS